ncbi:hypothetical protein evm_014087 [Chilo suppressalis]|nr:hypothetical protein evm_014087 [Chilo suppressalis]
MKRFQKHAVGVYLLALVLATHVVSARSKNSASSDDAEDLASRAGVQITNGREKIFSGLKSVIDNTGTAVLYALLGIFQ